MGAEYVWTSALPPPSAAPPLVFVALPPPGKERESAPTARDRAPTGPPPNRSS
jgi:hypothetical protein